MKSLLISILIWLLTIPVLIVIRKRERLCGVIGALSFITGGIITIASCIRIISSNSIESYHFNWSFVVDTATFTLDPLSAWFLIPICGLSALAGIYAVAYDNNPTAGFSKSFSWILFLLLLISMVLVVAAGNGVIFLMAWEVMAVASFFLVIRDNNPSSQDAGWIYLIATHLGTIFLIILFLFAASQTGSFDFSVWAKKGLNVPNPSLLFLCAVIGFGTKAGFAPLHIWLPEAHPAAPSHISAVMSGVMIKTGIYGLIRSLGWFDVIPHWWGVAIMFIGLVSGIIGVLFAIAQHDLKRLLAYHSVENIGIIALGIGIGIIGISYKIDSLAFLGFAGALLHVLNHSVFKGLLFLGAGSILHSTGERELERMGGLIKPMPYTGLTFLIGAMAISGLPPLNGFVSELMIFVSGVHSLLSKELAVAFCGVCLVGGLALIGGLAAACFAKAFGIIFVGQPRSENCIKAEESPELMLFPMVALAGLCVVIGLGGAWIVPAMASVIQSAGAGRVSNFQPYQDQIKNALFFVSFIGVGLMVLSLILFFIRKALLKNRAVTIEPTWDCGYADPGEKMQYSASSFAQPFLELFKPILRTKYHIHKPQKLFPQRASFHSETPDICHSEVYQPIFLKINSALGKFKFFQSGYIQIYILYIALTLIALLIWKLF